MAFTDWVVLRWQGSVRVYSGEDTSSWVVLGSLASPGTDFNWDWKGFGRRGDSGGLGGLRPGTGRPCWFQSVGGPGRDRTDDLFHAMEARSQLRHRPTIEDEKAKARQIGIEGKY